MSQLHTCRSPFDTDKISTIVYPLQVGGFGTSSDLSFLLNISLGVNNDCEMFECT